jgi:peroxiredoxin Q/BCP
MSRTRMSTIGATLALVCSTAVAHAQQPAIPPGVPAVGQVAPDFSIPGATRYGLLQNPVRLSDFRGQTVVIAFFIRARTKG